MSERKKRIKAKRRREASRDRRRLRDLKLSIDAIANVAGYGVVTMIDWKQRWVRTITIPTGANFCVTSIDRKSCTMALAMTAIDRLFPIKAER